MLTNMVAGDNLAIPLWRYTILGSFLYTLLRIMAYCMRHPNQTDDIDDSQGHPVLIFFTPTSENAIAPVESEFGGRCIGFRGKYGLNIPLRSLLVSILFSFRSLEIWKWVINDKRWRPWISDVIIYILVRRWSSVRFRNLRRMTFIYTNDHCCFDRGIVDPAADLGHGTIYIQHAPVTGIFPPLSADYSLLDGEQALRTYQGIEGSRGTVLICGRQYHITGIRNRRVVSRSALICTSTIDTLDNWKPIMVALGQAGYRVALRTHPSERQNRDWKRLASELDVEWLEAGQISLVSCLEKFSVVFAGQSGVLLDAALSGAVSVLVQFPQDTALGLYDYYGFAKTGVAHITDPGGISDTLQKIEDGGFAPLSGATFFDAATVLDANMQIRAVSAILADRSDASGLARAGFIPAPGDARTGMKIFVPARVSASSAPAVFSGIQPAAF